MKKINNPKSVVGISLHLKEAISILCDDASKDVSASWEPLLLDLINSEDANDQLTVVKKLGVKLKKQTVQTVSPVTCLSIKALVELFFLCPGKFTLKRVVLSCLQGTNECLQDRISDEMVKLLDVSLAVTSQNSVGERIYTISHLANITPAGHVALSSRLQNVFNFLVVALNDYIEQVNNISSPVLQTEKMHQCLTAIQTINKLLQKFTGTSALQPNESFQNLLQTSLEILKTDTFLLDCQVTCGMTIALVFRLFFKEATVCMLCFSVISHENHNDVQDVTSTGSVNIRHPVLDFDSISTSSQLCVINGMLAVLTCKELVLPLTEDSCFIVEVLGNRIFESAPGVNDTSSKLIMSRTLYTWTVKCCQCLEEMPNSTLLQTTLKGDQHVPKKVLEYVWTHWEDPIDAIRHQSRSIFDNILKAHLLATGEEPTSSSLIQELTLSLLKLNWHSKGKFGPLCTVVRYIGVENMLKLSPTLPVDVLNAAKEQTLANLASELYENLILTHKKEICQNNDTEKLKLWQKIWISPVLTALCHAPQKTFITEYIVPRLLKARSDSIQFIISNLLNEGKAFGVCQLRALMTCMKQARALGQVQQLVHTDENGSSCSLWNKILPVHVLQQALCHQDDQIRIDALGLLCESAKTTEIVTEGDLKLIRFFLPLNLGCQSPAFRQNMISLFKKLFMRLKESNASLHSSKRRVGPTEHMNASQVYKDFMYWIWCELFAHLHPGASYASGTSTLGLIATMTKAFIDDNTLCDIKTFLTSPHVQTLLECLTDNFEDKKMVTLEIFESFTVLPGLQTASEISGLLNVSLALTSTTRPQDCTTAAYFMKLLVRQRELYTCLKEILPSELMSETQFPENDQEGRILILLMVLVKKLSEQHLVAKTMLLHAAATQPMYPVLHCVRYLIAIINLRKVQHINAWKQLLGEIIQLCFSIASVVSPVVSHSSPEGNVPLNAYLDEESMLLSVLKSKNDDEELIKSAEESIRKVQKMPEYLAVCCWRSIKEVSLSLGQITQFSPIIEQQSPDGLITCEQLQSIGNYFIDQLLQTRHRGAFELAYAGFLDLSNRLWHCDISSLNQLPKQWLNQVMADIHQSNSSSSRLCATRRSAGVPFFIQALVTSEPTASGRSCFKQIMTELLHLALGNAGNTNSEDANNRPVVHALNILRSLYRDTRLGDDVYPFISDGIKATILGFSSNFWEVRNSSTLLFSALMTRIFGVTRTKYDQSRKNCLTGRVFFRRFPVLFQFMLDQLHAATENIGYVGVTHPALYPLLMMLGRLLPSTLEGTDTNVNVSAFIPYVMKCAASSVFKTRVMAARALQPLVFKNEVVNVLAELSKQLSISSSSKKPHNHIHGVLLQMAGLLKALSTTDLAVLSKLSKEVLLPVHRCRRLLSSANLCCVSRGSYLHVACKLLQFDWSVESGSLVRELMTSVSDVIQYSVFSSRNEKLAPGAVNFHLCVAQMVLYNSWKNKHCQELAAFSYKEVLSGLITSQHYEVRLIALQYIKALLSDDPEGDKLDVFDNSDYSFNSPDSTRTPRLKAAGKCWSFNDQSKDVVTELRKSGLILSQLVAMAMVTEKNPDCLAEVLSVLARHPLASVFPWEVAGTSYTSPEIMKWCLDLRKNQPREEVCCASIKISAILIPSLYQQLSEDRNSTVHELVSTWISNLYAAGQPDQSVDCRIACATSVSINVLLLLLDPDRKLGKEALIVWKLVIVLLQDDDVEVRNITSLMISQLWNHCEGSGFQTGDILSTLAINMALEILVDTFLNLEWHGCFQLFFDWIVGETKDDKTDHKRLFDRGELNSYEDVIKFTRLVCRHFLQFLKSSVPRKTEFVVVDVPNIWRDTSDCLLYHTFQNKMKPDSAVTNAPSSQNQPPQISVTTSCGKTFSSSLELIGYLPDQSQLTEQLYVYHIENLSSLMKIITSFTEEKNMYLDNVKYFNYVITTYQRIVFLFSLQSHFLSFHKNDSDVTGFCDDELSSINTFTKKNPYIMKNYLFSEVINHLENLNVTLKVSHKFNDFKEPS